MIFNKGYSLIEMLVVLMIFSIISLLSLSFVTTSVDSYFSVNSKTTELKNLISLTDILKRDLIHAVNIQPRNDLGVKNKSFFKINNQKNQKDFILEFLTYSSSDGVNNTGTLNKIKYVLEDGNLYRFSSKFLNSKYSENPLLLVANIKDIQIEVMSNQAYSAIWPLDINTNKLPDLINIRLDLNGSIFKKFFVVSNA
ncbi:GspJ family type II secretion system protein [SAR86 cluster bacterium]|jgi:type II secretion system protein J|nr:GspJ family type II secretion system protein [SAR86 cluster bacterium]